MIWLKKELMPETRENNQNNCILRDRILSGNNNLTHIAFESVGRSFVWVAGQYDLTVSLSKTKGSAVKAEIGGDGVSPVEVEGGVIEMVSDFTYLGSSLSDDGEVMLAK